MSKRAPNNSKAKASSIAGVSLLRQQQGYKEYELKRNGLRVLYKRLPGTGVVTTNIVYLVGARDERKGETGLAHMLEHMLFKPTEYDRKKKIDSSAMQFEREIGCVLNANTWKDRTAYYFSYPKEHLTRALEIEARRMHGVYLTDKVFRPEQGNVLSEFDMYFGDPEFALSVAMVGCAFHAGPYGHETIGTREDIEDYTVEKLERFYRDYYRPDNAVLTIIGDVDEQTALTKAKHAFGALEDPPTPVPRIESREPKQEGLRRVDIKRESSTNVLAIGLKHGGFPGKGWLSIHLALSALAEGPESILHKLLVDSGKAAKVEYMLEPTRGENLAILFITLSKGQTHRDVEEEVLKTIRTLRQRDVSALIKKAIAHEITDEQFLRTSSLRTTAALTEHIAAGDWSTFLKTVDLLKRVTVAEVVDTLKSAVNESQLTVGTYTGTTSS